MENNEIERLKEKFKINFFQIEKLLAQYAERISSIEKDAREVDELKREINEIKEYEKQLDKNLKKVEDGQVELEKKLTDENRNLLEKKEKEIEESVRERIEKAEYIGSKLGNIEKLVKEFNEKFSEWQNFKTELERDQTLYLELRKVVLASIEKLRNFEKIFSDNIDAFRRISTKVEENEKLYEKHSAETKKELLRLDEEGKRIERNVEEFKNNLREKLTKKFGDLDFKLEGEIKNKIKEQDTLLGSYGNKFAELENKLKEIENEIIPKKIDKEFNMMLMILNNKLKDLVTLEDFEIIRTELRSKVEQIRKPEMEPLEKRMIEMEKNIDELKNLLRGLSQRLPVVVE